MAAVPLPETAITLKSSSPDQDWVCFSGLEGVRLNAYLKPEFSSAITSRNSFPRAVMTGVAIASRQFWFMRTGPGTKKQSPRYSAIALADSAGYSINVIKRRTDRGQV